MAVFVEITTSPLEENFGKVRKRNQENTNSPGRAGRAIARRPTRGLEIKSDTYATLTVRTAQNKVIPLVDSSLPDGLNSTGYANFLLQSVSESRMEKHQIIETFGASYVFFFGEQPRFLDIAAQLINSNDFNWEAEWWANYNTYLRGTKLVEMGARCYLSYDDNIVEGYLMMANAVKTSDQPHLVPLQFKFFVTNCTNVSNVGNPNFPIRSSAMLPSGIQLTSGNAGSQLVSNLRGEAYLEALQEGFDTLGQGMEDKLRAAVPGTYRTLSSLIRETPPSFAVSADWWPAIEAAVGTSGSMGQLRNLVVRAGRPIRGLIASNTDEYVGFGDLRTQFGYDPGETNRPPSALKSFTRGTFEALDLFRQATEMLSGYGADINNPWAYKGLGFSASFGGSVGASFGASFGASAGFGFSAGTGVGLGAVAGGGFSARAGASLGFSASFKADALGAVYGTSSYSKKKAALASSNGYGYRSDFATKPGFGSAGYGDYGGDGFGSCNSAGDPGFRAANTFTYAGVAAEESAYERFLSQQNRNDRTALTAGDPAGRNALFGGASITVGGRISAFALVSVEGSLNSFGTAQDDPEYLSRKKAERGYGKGTGNTYGYRRALPGAHGLSAGTYIGTNSRVGVSAVATASAGVGIGAGGGASAGGGIGVGAGLGTGAAVGGWAGFG